MKTILLAGVPKSPNLGDGLIAYTINRMIRMRGSYRIIHFDLLDGRCPEEETPSEAAPVVRLNAAGLKKRATPDWMRMLKAYWLHRAKDSVMLGQVREAVAEADAVFIGGGHLLIDTYLTFPLSVRRVAREAKRQRKPLHIVFVGARGPWSLPAKRWFLEACRYAETIAVRDADSREFLLAMDASLADKTVALADPALYTLEAFPRLPAGSGTDRVPASRFARNRPVVGLGIMDPHEMKRHSAFRWERDECADWWRDAAIELTSRGLQVNVFTNGSATDNAFVEMYVKPRCAGLEGVQFLGYPTTVAGLVERIAACDAVIAQRLHACIPALSMMKPTYGLIWDQKLSSIFRELGLESHLVDFRRPASSAIAAMRLTEAPAGRFPELIRLKKEELYRHMGRILA